MGANKPVFPNIDADELEVTEVESLCVHCYENGITRMLLTKIPFYKDVVVISFTCDKCGYQNNELQSGAPIAEEGIRFILKVEMADDLNRQMVKSDYASVKISELDFEIPRKSQKGEITTVEGIINRVVEGLEQDQPVRCKENPELAKQIQEFINKLNDLKNVSSPFTLVLEDISGNSFIQNPRAPLIDPHCKVEYFKRTKDEDHELGIFTKEEVGGEQEEALLQPTSAEGFTLEDLEGEVLHFPTNCNSCNAPCTTNMKMTNIPHFKEVVIMSTNCESCGNRTNEVKSGGGIESRGTRIEISVNGKDDFTRDVLKSETCSLTIPNLELEVGPHALGGRFTTVEGLVVAIKEQLGDPRYSHMFGDSFDPAMKERLEKVIDKLEDVLAGNLKVTIILDDPAGNSYIQSLRDDNEPDSSLRIVHYERSFDQNEELGLNDMVLENYETNS